jgi:hypothetical protein
MRQLLPACATSCLLGLLAASCSDVRPPDPYLGTIDGSFFDPLFGGGGAAGTNVPRCIAPRRGFGGGSGLDPVSWIYLGGLSPAQLDITNAADPRRTPPTGAYVVSGCAPQGDTSFDPRTDNYLRSVQYPIMNDASPEPTAPAAYRPWHAVIDVAIRPEKIPRIGCNDIKGQRSLENRAGWDRERKVFGSGDYDPRLLSQFPYGVVIDDPGDELKIRSPSWDEIRGGKVKFKDWPMVNVAAPIMRTREMCAAWPPTAGAIPRYPRYPGDPNADFQFPSQSWLRGLLSGYLDGGDLPVTMEPARCPALIQTGKSCGAMMPCDMARAEACVMGRCLAPVPVCPVVNDLYVPQNEMTALATGSVTLMEGGSSRTADVLAIFAAVPGEPGYSPVCRLNLYDPAKLTCGRKEAEAIAPRPLCTAKEIAATPGAVTPSPMPTYVHCLFLPRT